MLLKLNYDHALNTGAKGEVNGKKTNFFMVMNVDETNFEQAIDRYGKTKGVVAFNFVGNPTFLQTSPLIGLSEKPILFEQDVSQGVDLVGVQQTMLALPQTIRVVFKLNEDFKDMRFVHSESQKYPNIRFEGGNLVRLAGCKIGAIDPADIPKKIAVSRIDLTPSPQNSAVMAYIHIDDVDTIEFYPFKDVQPKSSRVSKVKTPKTPKEKTSKSSKTSKPKKQLSSLLALTQDVGEFDNF